MYHHGINVREYEILQLKEVARSAEAEGKSLVFLPCHKSHIDYLVVSHILYCVGIGLPHIAAGGSLDFLKADNLNLPGIGPLLSYNGAFFIRRQWGDDKLYITVMKEYIEVEYLINASISSETDSILKHLLKEPAAALENFSSLNLEL